jgi:arylsulfatase A-like enzyme
LPKRTSEPDLDVPLIAYCPARIPGGRVSEALTDNTDIFPTLLELAGVPLPPGRIDGRSFAGVLQGRGNPLGARLGVFDVPH